LKTILTPREQGHLAHGHWHFDITRPAVAGVDYIPIGRVLSADLCRQLLAMKAQSTKSMTFDGNFYSNSADKYQDTEARLDFQEALPNKNFDLNRPWFTSHYLDAGQDIVDQVEQQLGVEIIKNRNNHMLNIMLRVAVQRPGDVTMNHIDHVYDDKLSQRGRYADPAERRLVVFLEDHVPGQYFVMGNHSFGAWRQGQAFTWDWGIPHHTANMSSQPRYTLIMNLDARKNQHLGYKVWN